MAIRKTIPAGTTYGFLTVRREADPVRSGRIAYSASHCECRCGKSVVVVNYTLRNGGVKSCGCSRIQHGGAKRHGPRAPEYLIWLAMRNRCYRPSDKRYASYGGRGIEVCDAWRHSYASFIADMGERPSAQHSIDRINSDGNYEPSNCRWATMREQQNNRTNNRRLTFYGQSKTCAEWSLISQISPQVISARLISGWSEKEAVWTPVGFRGHVAANVIAKNRSITVSP